MGGGGGEYGGADADNDIDTDTDVDSYVDTDTDVDVDSDIDIDTDIDIDIDVDVDTDIDTDVDSDIDIDTDIDTDSDSGIDIDSEFYASLMSGINFFPQNSPTYSTDLARLCAFMAQNSYGQPEGTECNDFITYNNKTWVLIDENYHIKNNNTGFDGVAYYNAEENRAVIAYRGTEFNSVNPDAFQKDFIEADIRDFGKGKLPKQFESAYSFTSNLRMNFLNPVSHA